ncbi:MAG: putative nucleotide-diphospho-sugar transferase [Pseudomonadota bacterium]
MIETGYIYAVTGKIYRDLAVRSARSLRTIHPEAEIDLYTDRPEEIENGDIFNQIHPLSESWFRPKMEAMIETRFERALYLDADTMVVADLSSVFDVLKRFDIAMTHDSNEAGSDALYFHRNEVPEAFVAPNSGVMGVRKSDRTQTFLKAWQKEVRESGADRDQPALRKLLFESDLRLYILSPMFNFMAFLDLETRAGSQGAPRLLHAPGLHEHSIKPSSVPLTMEELVGGRHATQVKALIAADRRLTPPDRLKTVIPPIEATMLRRLRRLARRLLKS